MARLNKTGEIIELAIMLQNSYSGFTIDDIATHFECSRRTAERMKALLIEKFPDKIEEVETLDKKKHWRFKKGSINFFVTFTQADLILLQQVMVDIKDKIKRKYFDSFVEKIKTCIA